MFLELWIKDFESHLETRITFVEGFNALVGLSNSGKTSVIRVLDLICNNNFDKNSIRLDAINVEAKLITDKGSVYVKRGKVNEWIVELNQEDGSIKTFNYEKVGKAVPERVFEVTDVKQVEMGDYSDNPNFMMQLDKHFMLAEINGKKCTSNATARMIDKIVGLGGMEELITDISSDISKKKRILKDNQRRISTLKTEKHDEFVLQKREVDITFCKKKIKSYQESQEILTQLQEIYSDFLKRQTIFNNLVFELNKMPDYNLLSIQIQELICKSTKLQNLKELQKRHNETQATIETQTQYLEKYKDIDMIANKAKDIKIIIDSHVHLNSLLEKGKNTNLILTTLKARINKFTDLDKLEEKYNDVSKLCKNILGIKDKYHKIKELELEITKSNDSLKGLNENVEQLELEKSNFKKEHPICPLCGSDF